MDLDIVRKVFDFALANGFCKTTEEAKNVTLNFQRLQIALAKIESLKKIVNGTHNSCPFKGQKCPFKGQKCPLKQSEIK